MPKRGTTGNRNTDQPIRLVKMKKTASGFVATKDKYYDKIIVSNVQNKA